MIPDYVEVRYYDTKYDLVTFHRETIITVPLLLYLKENTIFVSFSLSLFLSSSLPPQCDIRLLL